MSTQAYNVDEIIKRARGLLLSLGWRGNPVFLIPSTKVVIRVSLHIQTACVTPRGIMYVNPYFVGKLTDEEFMFVLAHELLHLLMMHFGRQGSRTQKRWNRAADRAINIVARALQLTAPSHALFPLEPEHEEYTAEELYEVEPKQASDGGQNGSQPSPDGGQGNEPLPGGGCGPVEDSSDDTLLGDGETPDGGYIPSVNEAARQWRQAAASAKAYARNPDAGGAGSIAGNVLARLLDAPPSRVKWRQLLTGAASRAATKGGRDDVSWSRRNRRSFGGEFILPGPVSYAAMVAAAVDTSGSVPEKSIAQAVTEVGKIAEAAKVPIYLVIHDSIVQWQGWIQPGMRRRAIEGLMMGRGGTLFSPVYDAIEATGKRFDAFVHLTDGMPCEDPWPAKPKNVRKPIVALIGAASLTSVPSDFKVVEAEV